MPVAKKVGKKPRKNKLTINKNEKGREEEVDRGREAAEEVDSEWESGRGRQRERERERESEEKGREAR